MAYSWMKLHCNLLDNPKTGFLPDTLWRKYVELGLIAKEYDHDGELPPVDAIAWRLRITPEQCNETLQALEKNALVKLNSNEPLQNDTKTYFLPDFLASQEPEPVEKRVSEHRQRAKIGGKQEKSTKNSQKTEICNDSLHRQQDNKTIVVVSDDVIDQFKKDLWALKKINFQSVKKDLLPKADLVHRWAEAVEFIPDEWGAGLIITMLRAGEEPPTAPEPEPEHEPLIIHLEKTPEKTPAEALFEKIVKQLSFRRDHILRLGITPVELNGRLVLSTTELPGAKRLQREFDRITQAEAGVNVEFIAVEFIATGAEPGE